RVVGRAISGGFLCHGLHTGKVLCLDDKYGTMVHVMPVTSIARIIKMPRESLEKYALTSPVFSSSPSRAKMLGLIDEIIDDSSLMKPKVVAAIQEVTDKIGRGEYDAIGPMGRFAAAVSQGGRKKAGLVTEIMREQADKILNELAVFS
ncbi:MAG: biotin-independent malonate decarboxylase subunit gamma, partial [Lentisphaerae bacterium]|nr:biotin-independent malonate decarboxylase subunit gamma [Lentisphaerota bacterium]